MCEESKYGSLCYYWQILAPLGFERFLDILLWEFFLPWKLVTFGIYDWLHSSCCSPSMRKLQTLQPMWKPTGGKCFCLTLTSKQHLGEVKASQKCPQFAKNVLTLKVETQIGFPQRLKTHAMCYQLWPVSSSDSTVCSCNTMTHYLEPHTHTHTYNGAASGHQISGDWPFPHPEATSLFLLTNQNGGLAESVMWNQGSWLNTSNRGHSWRPTETTAAVFHTLSLLQNFLTLLYPDTYCLQTPSAAYTQPENTIQQDTDTHTSESFALWDLHCGLLLWINHFGGWLCVLRTGLMSV